MGGIHRYPGAGGYGAKLKDDYRRYYGATIGFSGRGEQIPNADCYCEIDPTVVDQWGIPVLRFHWKWTDHEYNQVEAHAGDVPRADRGDGRAGVLADADARAGLRHRGGRRASSTSSAACAWATIPPTSVLNQRTARRTTARICSSTDGGPFVSQADKNPTWTILALAWRTSDYITEQRKRGAL